MHKSYIRPLLEEGFVKVFQGIPAVDVDCCRRQVGLCTEQGRQLFRIVALEGFVYFLPPGADLIRGNGVRRFMGSREEGREHNDKKHCSSRHTQEATSSKNFAQTWSKSSLKAKNEAGGNSYVAELRAGL